MISLTSAFLICNTFLASHGLTLLGYPYHPMVYEALARMEDGTLSARQGARLIALVDSERGIPLAECLLEQTTDKRLYPSTPYPKPPYTVGQMFKRKAR